MRKVFVWIATSAVIAALGGMAALAVWIYPDVSAIRGHCELAATSTYPSPVLNAFLAAEDPDFLHGSRPPNGGVTLTQQMVRSEMAAPVKSISRIPKELLVAFIVQHTVPRPYILNAYLDHVYLGSRTGKLLFGVRAAARAYFGKAPEALTLSEAATLAGMVRQPRYYSVAAHPDRALQRRNNVLSKMRSHEFVTAHEYASSVAEPIRSAPN